MAEFINKDFSGGTPTTALETHDASWVKHGSYGSGSFVISNTTPTRVRGGVDASTLYYNTASPASADQDLTVVLYCYDTDAGNQNFGIGIHWETGANTGYVLRYFGSSSDNWVLQRYNAGSVTTLATEAQGWTANTSKTVFISYTTSGANGVLLCKVGGTDLFGGGVTDTSPLTSAGKVALRHVPNGGPGDGFGIHVTSLVGNDAGGGGGSSLPLKLQLMMGA